MLWDKICWPSNNYIKCESNDDEKYLESAGFLARPHFQLSGPTVMGESLILAQIHAFNILERKEPSVWSLAQGINSLNVPGLDVVNRNNAFLKLNQAVPVPDQDVPFAEVLEFKKLRADEIQKMRFEIDTLVSKVESAEDKMDELNRQIEIVDQACADAIRVGHEWRFPIRLTNFKAAYKFRPFQTLAGGLVGAFGGQAATLPVTQQLLLGLVGTTVATASTLELTWDAIEWRGIKSRIGPYQYVYDFHREFFL